MIRVHSRRPFFLPGQHFFLRPHHRRAAGSRKGRVTQPTDMNKRLKVQLLLYFQHNLPSLPPSHPHVPNAFLFYFIFLSAGAVRWTSVRDDNATRRRSIRPCSGNTGGENRTVSTLTLRVCRGGVQSALQNIYTTQQVHLDVRIMVRLYCVRCATHFLGMVAWSSFSPASRAHYPYMSTFLLFSLATPLSY